MTDRAVPTHARELAARLSEPFQRDVEIVKRLRDAQRRLSQANERLWSGLHPDGFGLVYDSAAAAIGTSEIAMLMRDRCAGRLDPSTALLEALQQAHWQIHRGFYAYQHASEERRQLAIEVGEYSQQLPRRSPPPAGARKRHKRPTCTSSSKRPAQSRNPRPCRA